MDKKIELKKQLNFAEALFRIYKSDDFQTHLLPLLDKVISSSYWPNPADYKTNEEFMIAYNSMYGKTKAYEEFLRLFTGAESQINSIREQLKKPDKKYGVK